MVSIFMCGIRGSGKTNLSAAIQSKLHRKVQRRLKRFEDIPNQTIKSMKIDNVDDLDKNDYYDLQQNILEHIIGQEELCSDSIIISDHCILDCLVHTCFRLGEEEYERLYNAYRTQCKSSIERYQKSLVLLLTHPEQNDVNDRYETFYTKYVNSFNVPYIKLSGASADERVNEVIRALKGKCYLNSSSLDNYSRKHKKEVVEHCTVNFSFFIEKPKKRECVCLPTLTVTEHEVTQSWTVEPSGETNRFLAYEKKAQDKLFLLEFDTNVRSTVVQMMLLSGVTVNGKLYSFLGCSSKGIKHRKCFMWKGCPHEAEDILRRHGTFDQPSVSKQMARISLLFTGVKLTGIVLNPDAIVMEEDITSNGKCFTDGCGGISFRLAQKVFDRVRGPGLHDNEYLPSVYQIRLQGYKGVLVLDKSLGDAASVKVRPSMKKFETNKHPQLGICDYSKPHTFGHLNKQFILLLSGLGIPDDIFLEKQKIHFDLIQNMGKDPEKTITVLQWQNLFDHAQIIMRNTSETLTKLLYPKEVLKTISSLQQKLVSKVEKLSVLIPKSRHLFGVCDPTGALKYGQCFLRVTMGQHPKTITGQVVVIKSPCYLLGDVRVLNAVGCAGISQLNDLVDCIVFPTHGKRPHPDEIAGSDLDGDQFFVTWDETLIPKKMKQPYDYTGANSHSQGKITREKKIHYFANQNEPTKLTGKINKYFLKWADLKGIESEECERLGILFSRNIDAAKTGEKIAIPVNLIPPNGAENTQMKVWEKMRNAASQFRLGFAEPVIRNENDLITADLIREEFVVDTVRQDFSSITEYQKFRFVWSYIENSNNDEETKVPSFIEKYADYINFALFSNEEKREALAVGIPSEIIENALNKSRILSYNDLAFFNMHTRRTPWKYYFRSDHSGFDWENLLKALTSNDCVFLILKLPDHVTIALQFLSKCTRGEEQKVSPGTIIGYFFSKRFGYKEKYILGPNYLLDLSESTFQLYRNYQKNLTFIWLKASDVDLTQGPRRNQNALCDELMFQISVDLLRFKKQIYTTTTRHPLVNKIPFISIEVFVQSRTSDVPYFDTLEANFLEQVTEEKDFEVDDDEEGEDDKKVDFSFMKPESKFVLYVEDKERMTALEDAVKKLNLLTFKSLLCLTDEFYQESPNMYMYFQLFIDLLEGIIRKVCPYGVPEQVGEIINDITVILLSSGKINSPGQHLHLAASLSKLKLDDVVPQFACLESCPIPVSEFLDLVTNWQNWWYIDQSISLSVIANIAFPNDPRSCLERYICFYGKLQLLNFLGELQSVKDRLTTRDTDFSITNLKVEKREDCIGFYRSSTLNHNPKITKGQYVVVTRQRDLKQCPSYKAACFVGQVESVRYAPVTIAVNAAGKIPEVLEDCLRIPKGILWRIDLFANVATHRRVMKALHVMLQNGERHTPIIDFIIHPEGHPPDSELFQNQPFNMMKSQDFDTGSIQTVRLNTKQREAISRSLNQTVTLIQGPPGTGKTTVACEIIKETHNTRKFQKILVVAETNTAADNLVKQLRKDLPFDLLRMGNEEVIDTEVYDISLEGQLRTKEELEAKKTTYKDDHGDLNRKQQLAKKIISQSPIVLTTCAGSGDPILDSFIFDFIVVDEATQTKETTLLCSLVKGAKCLVMIGDPKQLGPVIVGANCLATPDNLSTVSSLKETLFHRLARFIPPCTLDTQYRMHAELMKFPSVQFYENKLLCGVHPARKIIVFPWPEPKRPFCFVDISNGRECRVGSTFYNTEEAKVVQDVLNMLMNVGEEQSDKRLDVTEIAVVTPYQGQVKEISRTINHKVEVGSIDGFQGREKEVIIVSCVRTFNSNRTLDFLEDEQRLNVMLTRAKRGLIVIGNESALQSIKSWALWLQQAPRLDIERLTQSAENHTTYQRGRGGWQQSRGKGVYHRRRGDSRADAAGASRDARSFTRVGTPRHMDEGVSETLYNRRSGKERSSQARYFKK